MAKRSTAKAARGAADPAQHVIASALKLAAGRDWHRISLADIAAAARLPLARVYALFPSRQAILDAFSRDLDMRLLAGVADEPTEGSARDRLFDVVMRRFDLLVPHRDAVRSILRSTCRDPLALLCGVAQFRRSLACMLEAAGIPAGGLAGAVRAKGLAAVYLSVLCVWLADDSADKSKTMAALDRHLRRVESCLSIFSRRRTAATAT